MYFDSKNHQFTIQGDAGRILLSGSYEIKPTGKYVGEITVIVSGSVSLPPFKKVGDVSKGVYKDLMGHATLCFPAPGSARPSLSILDEPEKQIAKDANLLVLDLSPFSK
jgi:hypothetical protein